MGTKLVSVTTEMNTPRDIQAAHYWQQTNHYAAKRRLGLARRYQDEYDRLDAEFDNLRNSHSWLATQSSEESAHLLIAYVEVLGSYLRQRGLIVELSQWCEGGVRASERLQKKFGWLLLRRSEAQMFLGRWNEAEADIHAAIESSQKEDQSTYAKAILALGRLQLNQGNYQTALETLATAEKHLIAQSDIEGLITVRVETAAYQLRRGKLDKALSLYLEAEQLRQQTNTIEAAKNTLLMLGVVYRMKINYNKAMEHLQKLLDIAKMQGDRGTIATTTHHLAWVYLNQGNLGQARRLCGQAIDLYEEMDDTRGVSDAYEQLGLIEWAEGHGEEALSYLEQSLNLRRQLGNQHGTASSLRRLAVVHLQIGHLAIAGRHFWQSLAIYWQLGVLSRQRFMAILRELFEWTVGQRRRTM